MPDSSEMPVPVLLPATLSVIAILIGPVPDAPFTARPLVLRKKALRSKAAVIAPELAVSIETPLLLLVKYEFDTESTAAAPGAKLRPVFVKFWTTQFSINSDAPGDAL